MWGVYIALFIFFIIFTGDDAWWMLLIAIVPSIIFGLVFGKKMRNHERRYFKKMAKGDEAYYRELCAQRKLDPEMEE